MNVYKISSPWSTEYITASNFAIAEKLYHQATKAQMVTSGFDGDNKIKSMECLGMLVGAVKRTRRKRAK